MIGKIINWFKTTTFDGKITKEVGTVFGKSKTGETSVEVQKLKKYSSNQPDHIRLKLEYTGFAYIPGQVILDRSEAIKLIRFLEDAVSDSSENTNG